MALRMAHPGHRGQPAVLVGTLLRYQYPQVCLAAPHRTRLLYGLARDHRVGGAAQHQRLVGLSYEPCDALGTERQPRTLCDADQPPDLDALVCRDSYPQFCATPGKRSSGEFCTVVQYARLPGGRLADRKAPGGQRYRSDLCGCVLRHHSYGCPPGHGDTDGLCSQFLGGDDRILCGPPGRERPESLSMVSFKRSGWPGSPDQRHCVRVRAAVFGLVGGDRGAAPWLDRFGQIRTSGPGSRACDQPGSVEPEL